MHSDKNPKPTAITRRKILHQTGLGFGAAALTPLHRSLAAVTNEQHRAATLEDAYKILGFDPHAGDSFTSLWMADIHYGIGKAEDILPPMIAEITPMNPRPSFIGIVGDLIVSASHSFGTIPNDADRKKTEEEYRMMKPHYDELTKLAPVKLTLGNHDTYPGEEDRGLFRSVFGDTPVTHAFKMKGVPFIIANGGSCGLLGDKQQKWFNQQVKKLHRPDGTLVTAIHQPSVGKIVRERGITMAVREAFAETQGDLWVIGGHVHSNGDRSFRIPNGDTLINASITAANPAVWGREQPGYWIWCFNSGQLVGRIFRRVGDDAGYTVSPPETATLQKTQALLLPFENREDILWKVMVGEGDEKFRLTTKAAWCLNYWAYTKQLEYRFPLSLAKNKARRCVVLMDSMAGKNKSMNLFVSADGTHWRETQPVTDGSYHTIDIPDDCLASGTIALRMENSAVSGFALLG